ADRNRSHWSTSKTPSYTKSVSWQHHQSRYPMYTLVNKAIDDRKIGAAMYIFSSHNGFSTIKYPKGIKYIIANS
ncbi:hypothetical protein, partial [Escherichia coli]|uniref:hypothetical protein n=1 Tax=Escherichia coli TaxID=562 RepID=UPI001BC89CE1